MKNTCEMPARRPQMTTAQATLVALLAELRRRFYAQLDQSLFYRDRRALARALTWPALWLDRRGVYCSQARYQALLIARLEAIQEHGDAGKHGAFFPAYLLKCLQDWFAWHGEELYLELKHARNAIEIALLSVGFDDESRGKPRSDRSTQDPIVALASLHRVLGANKRTAKARTGMDQFLLRLS
jgi:hypothetical protein